MTARDATSPDRAGVSDAHERATGAARCAAIGGDR